MREFRIGLKSLQAQMKEEIIVKSKFTHTKVAKFIYLNDMSLDLYKIAFSNNVSIIVS